MVQEAVPTPAAVPGGPRARPGVKRGVVVLAVVLTLGQLFLWPNHDAHRSVFGFVMTCLWTGTCIALAAQTIVGPGEPERTK